MTICRILLYTVGLSIFKFNHGAVEIVGGTNFIVGDTITLTCQKDVAWLDTIKWSASGIVGVLSTCLTTGDNICVPATYNNINFTTQINQMQANLTITNAQLDDSRTYTCLEESFADAAYSETDSHNITVQAPETTTTTSSGQNMSSTAENEPTTAATVTAKSTSDNGGFSTGAIVGISIGSGAAAVGGAGAVVVGVSYKKKVGFFKKSETGGSPTELADGNKDSSNKARPLPEKPKPGEVPGKKQDLAPIKKV